MKKLNIVFLALISLIIISSNSVLAENKPKSRVIVDRNTIILDKPIIDSHNSKKTIILDDTSKNPEKLEPTYTFKSSNSNLSTYSKAKEEECKLAIKEVLEYLPDQIFFSMNKFLSK